MRPLYTAITGVVLVASVMVLPGKGQDQAASQPTTIQHRTPDQVVETLAAKLNLTDDQKNQIRPIIAERQQKMADLRSDTSMRPRRKLKKMKEVFSDSDKKIEAILDDQQKQQYIQMEQQMKDQLRERMQNRRSGASGDSQ